MTRRRKPRADLPTTPEPWTPAKVRRMGDAFWRDATPELRFEVCWELSVAAWKRKHPGEPLPRLVDGPFGVRLAAIRRRSR